MHPILKSLNNGEYVKRIGIGDSCVFVPLNTRLGLKLYGKKCIQKDCMSLQQKAYEAGLAPKVREEFKFESDSEGLFISENRNRLYGSFLRSENDWGKKLKKTYKIYGFYTDRVSVLSWIDDWNPEKGVRLNKNLIWTESKYYREVDKLETKLYEIGISHGDLVARSLGWYKDRLVCIDFDFNSCFKAAQKEIVKMKIYPRSKSIVIDLTEGDSYGAYKQHEDESGNFSFGNSGIVCIQSNLYPIYLTAQDKEFFNSFKTCDKNIWHRLFENYLFRKLAEHGQTREFVQMLCEMQYEAGKENGRKEVQRKMREALGL